MDSSLAYDNVIFYELFNYSAELIFTLDALRRVLYPHWTKW